MIEAKISSVPVLTEKHQLYYGWIDWVPIVEYVVSHFMKEKANGVEGSDDETKTAVELMEDSAHFKTLTVHGMFIAFFFSFFLFKPIIYIFFKSFQTHTFSHSYVTLFHTFVLYSFCKQHLFTKHHVFHI